MTIIPWLDAAYRLVETIFEETGILVYAIGFLMFWLVCWMFVYWSDSRRR